MSQLQILVSENIIILRIFAQSTDLFDDVYIYIAQESSGLALSKDLQSWPQDEETFLAIGTLGNNIISKEEEEEDTDSSKDLTATNTDVSIGKKKSISFLLKKMFVCTSGFKTPPPLLDLSRDSLPNTRMEKVLHIY